MNVVLISTMIDHGVQLVLANRIRAVYVNVTAMQNVVASMLFDMLKRIIHLAVFVKIVNIIPLDHVVNSVKISFTKITLYQSLILMSASVRKHYSFDQLTFVLLVSSL